ncbi:uncharacterized protein LOC144705290 [Wolffia australiana]
MAEYSRRGQVPSFGSWAFLETACLENNLGFDGHHRYPPPQRQFYPAQAAEDLYTVPWKARRGRTREKKEAEKNAEAVESGSQNFPRRRSRVHMAVDEDLYKIPPELLRRKSSMKTPTICKLFSSCLCTSSIP